MFPISKRRFSMNIPPDNIPERLQRLVGESVADLDTPALVVDLDAVNRNLQRMAEFAERHRVQLRPHAKTHKSPAFAHMQVQAGAVGVCVQTVAEAEALAAGGIDDIFISNQIIATSKLRRVAALAHRLGSRSGQLAIAVDSAEGIERLAQAMQITGAAIDVLVEVDVGQGRCGVAPGEPTVGLVRLLNERSSRLRYAGLQAYHGGAQHLQTVSARREAITQAANWIKRTRQLLIEADLAPGVITGGGTGTFGLEAASGVWTELQPGSYLFMDADYQRNERDPAQPGFEPALLVKAQVISVSEDHAVCDAGHKSHAIDSGLPTVLALPGQPSLVTANGGDEHTILRPSEAALGDGLPELPALGDTVWLIPGHCDPTVNLHSHFIVVRDGLVAGTVETIVPVLARGQW